MDPWEPIPGDLDWWQDGDQSRNQRYYYAWDNMRRNLGYTRKIALSFDMNALIPDTGFCTSTYCLANRNQQYICFFPAGGTEGVDLTGLDGEFKVAWLNPATGITMQENRCLSNPVRPMKSFNGLHYARRLMVRQCLCFIKTALFWHVSTTFM